MRKEGRRDGDEKVKEGECDIGRKVDILRESKEGM